MKKSEIIFLIFSLLMAAIVGGLLGDIIGEFLPDGAAKTLFQKHLPIGFDPPFTLDLFAIKLTLGLMVKANFMSVLFMVMVVIYFRWWYI